MDMRRCFVEDTQTHQIRFNQTGITRFRYCFAEIGIRLDQIRTRSQFDAALELSYAHESQKYGLDRYGVGEDLSEDDFNDEGDIF